MKYKLTTLSVKEKFMCENGTVIPELDIAYSEYGNLDSDKVIVFLGGFSTSLKLHEWWRGGLEKFNLEKYKVISINSLGSLHGTTGTQSKNPKTMVAYRDDFPYVSISDQVEVFKILLNKLGLSKVSKVIGCSLGGMQVLDFYFRYPSFSEEFISIAGIKPSKITRLYNIVQINMLENATRTCFSEEYIFEQLKSTRMISRLLCTTEAGLEQQLYESNNDDLEYLNEYFINDAQSFSEEFCPFSYMRLTQAVNDFNIGPIPSQDTIVKLVRANKAGRLSLVGIQGDSYTPSEHIRELYENLAKENIEVTYEEFLTQRGHESWITDISNFKNMLVKYVQ